VKVVSCSQPWGVSMMATDGVHEEAVSLFPDHLSLVNAKKSVDFDAAGDFHTIRLEVKGEDVRLYADGELVIDAGGEFKQPAIDKRNQCSFGAAASAAEGEAVWQWVVRRACLAAWRCKSSTQPDGGEGLAKRKGVAARRGPKEAWSKAATRRTGTGYEAVLAGRACHDTRSPFPSRASGVDPAGVR